MSKQKLIIDTNLLLLLVIGAVEEGRHIRNSDRLGKFEIADYDSILNFISEYDTICITPYIATEVSNLIDLNDYARDYAFIVARELFSTFEEIKTSIIDDISSGFFEGFGITDSSLISLAKKYDILTDDNRMLTPLYESGPYNIKTYMEVRHRYQK